MVTVSKAVLVGYGAVAIVGADAIIAMVPELMQRRTPRAMPTRCLASLVRWLVDPS
jgi:hypothetical protein